MQIKVKKYSSFRKLLAGQHFHSEQVRSLPPSLPAWWPWRGGSSAPLTPDYLCHILSSSPVSGTIWTSWAAAPAINILSHPRILGDLQTRPMPPPWTCFFRRVSFPFRFRLGRKRTPQVKADYGGPPGNSQVNSSSL